MRVAVYSIALNEEQFIAPWVASAAEADLLLIGDTGSTDGTVEAARKAGVDVAAVTIVPWRFDLARNASLAAIGRDFDYCIALDMDEQLQPGWRAALEVAHEAGWSRPRYSYTWNWNSDGTPGLVYGGDKIHSRAGYRWKHPVHEVLVRYGDLPETHGWVDLQIHHHPDNSKPRTQYYPLLKQAVAEDPEDDRNTHYLAREMYFNGEIDAAVAEFTRHLGLKRSVWPAERAQSMRYLAKMVPERREYWLIRAADEAPGRREALVDLAQYYYEIGYWRECFARSLEALRIIEKPLEYLCEAEAWGAHPYDLVAISAYNLGLYSVAEEYGRRAVELAPTDERYRANLAFYASSVSAELAKPS